MRKRRATHSVFLGATLVVCAPTAAALAGALVAPVLIYVFIPQVLAGIGCVTKGLLSLRALKRNSIGLALYLLHQLSGLSQAWHHGR